MDKWWIERYINIIIIIIIIIILYYYYGPFCKLRFRMFSPFIDELTLTSEFWVRRGFSMAACTQSFISNWKLLHFLLAFFHLSFRLTANNFIHHKQYLESGVLLKQDTSRPRILSRKNELRRPIVSWNKWGYTCVHLPAKDLTICIDIHPNPGPCSEKYSNAQEGNTRYHYKLNTQHAAVQLPIVYNSSQLPASWITGYCRLNSTLLSTTASFNILRYQGSRVGRSIQGSKMAENRRFQVRISSRY